jgi:hypothetical protein
LMSFWVLSNNLSPCLNCNFHLKGIKRNVLNNAIDFNFLSWISMHTSMFSNVHIMHCLNNVGYVGYKIHFERATSKMIFIYLFIYLVDFFYSASLEFVAPNVGKMCRKFSCKETC